MLTQITRKRFIFNSLLRIICFLLNYSWFKDYNFQLFISLSLVSLIIHLASNLIHFPQTFLLTSVNSEIIINKLLSQFRIRKRHAVWVCSSSSTSTSSLHKSLLPYFPKLSLKRQSRLNKKRHNASMKIMSYYGKEFLRFKAICCKADTSKNYILSRKVLSLLKFPVILSL